MALILHAPAFTFEFTCQVSRPHGRVLQTTQCTATSSSMTTKSVKNQTDIVVRRSADYKPPMWDDDYVQSLSSNYLGDVYLKQAVKLKNDVKIMLDKVVDPLDGFELIDDLQRLGVFYHFNEKIKRILERIHNIIKWNKEENLHATALKFRLLRQHGYNISQEVFKNFKDESGNFKSCICEDIKGLLYLYEASYFSVEGENILDEARDFSTKILKQSLKMSNNIDEDLGILVSHALELPLHWRVPRLEARWFIDLYKKRSNMNPTLLQLAQLDFNMVQATHQEDLKYMSRWWKRTGLGEKLSFSRDMIVENFLWNVGLDFKPQFSNQRKNLTMVFSLVTVIDDVYDVYGTLDELEPFTDAIERWDIGATELLPVYMMICFLALFNFINEMGYDTLKEQGILIIPYLQKLWADLCKSYLVEAKWYYSGYTPSFKEYMDNACISISGHVVLAHANILYTNSTTKEDLESFEKYSDLIKWSSTICRLADDLGTSPDEMKRGDIPKSIQCYMYETGASEEVAREHIKYLISETWKKLNSEMWKKMNKARPGNSSFCETSARIARNLTRMALCMYQYGNDHGVESDVTKDRVLSLLLNPIPIV